MKKSIVLLGILLSTIACKPTQDKNQDPQPPECQLTGDTLVIPPRSVVGQKIRLLRVNPERINLPCVTTGTVRALPECIADVAVPFDGRIVESFVRAGQTVKAGSPLFSIHSPVFFETVKTFLQARQEKQVAELNLRRQQDLVDHGVGIQKELDEACLNYDIAKGQYESLLATLAIFNVNPAEIEVGKPLMVTSPIKGEVVSNAIRVGQYLTADSDPMVCVADLRKVWVIAQVKETKIGLIQNQDEVTITIDAFPDKLFPGFVSYIGKMIDEQTRSLEVIIECENTEQYLKPGMFATVTFSHASQEGILLPATALIQDEVHTFVYKSIGKDRYVRTEVEVITAFDGKVIIQNGIAAGDTVISEGSIYLQ